MDWQQKVKSQSKLKSINFKELTIEEFMQEQNIESMNEILNNDDLREVFLKDMKNVLLKEEYDEQSIDTYIRKLKNKYKNYHDT